jgi:hypothetical protein
MSTDPTMPRHPTNPILSIFVLLWIFLCDRKRIEINKISCKRKEYPECDQSVVLIEKSRKGSGSVFVLHRTDSRKNGLFPIYILDP